MDDYLLLMYKANFSPSLKCPYCDEERPSHQELKVHIGKQHKEKTDEFMEIYLGGRWIEVDFISLMLKKSIGEVSKAACVECGNCDVACPISITHEGFHPYDIPLQLQGDKVREVLKSNIIWGCTKCYACGEDCKAGMAPLDVIETLMNLSSRIGYHVPRKYKDYDKSVLKSGVIQRQGAVKMVELTRMARDDVGFPELPAQPDHLFKEAMRKLAEMRDK